MTHAWCHDTARDAAVRAAEDNRTGPFPTLEECIAMIPKSVSASCTVEHENKGDDMTMRDKQAADYRAEQSEREAPAGLRRERVTLEVTYNPNIFPPTTRWAWESLLRLRSNDGESVRVVSDEEREAEAIGLRRDAAAARNRVEVLEAGNSAAHKLITSLESQLESVACRAATAETALEAASGEADPEDADIGYALRLFVDGRRVMSHELDRQQASAFVISADHLAKYIRDEYQPPVDEATPAASGGGEWPRGWLTAEEREAVLWAADAAYNKQHPDEDILRSLLARSSPPEVVLPFVDPALARIVYGRDSEWLAALAAAGVAVKEVGRE